jgi:hypothetical protein
MLTFGPGHLALSLLRVESLDDSSTGSESALSMAGLWLHTCLTEHVQCSQYSESSPPLPPRVIDVGPADGSEEPFLCTTKDRRGHYLTLSHRWGNYDEIKTKQATLDKRSTCMPIRILPKVFRDAVYITRKLGIRFLWIDSLCIVQDDPSDWKFQASKMADIFRNSLMTIASAAVNTQTHGIFRQRAPQRKRPCAINLRLSHRQKALFQKPGVFFAFADRREMAAAERPLGILDTRAWILQEQILSPRTLYFTEDELFWDCVCLNASETYPTGIPDLALDRRSSGQTFASFKKAVASHRIRADIPTKEEIYKIWRQIVQAYSRRAISVETDRIVAIMGITDLVEKVLNEKCIFGLWGNHFNSEEIWQELLWSVDMSSLNLRAAREKRGEGSVVMRNTRFTSSRSAQARDSEVLDPPNLIRRECLTW